jgi:hypothetical protein
MKVTNAGLQNDAETQDVSFETIFSGTAKAWSNLNGTSTIAERNSFNISGYVDNGTGDYTATISSDMSAADYAANSAAQSSGGDIRSGRSNAVGSTGILTQTPAGAAYDEPTISLSIDGDLA